MIEPVHQAEHDDATTVAGVPLCGNVPIGTHFRIATHPSAGVFIKHKNGARLNCTTLRGSPVSIEPAVQVEVVPKPPSTVVALSPDEVVVKRNDLVQAVYCCRWVADALSAQSAAREYSMLGSRLQSAVCGAVDANNKEL